MLRQMTATKFVTMCFKRSTSTRAEIYDILTAHLKVNSEVLNKLDKIQANITMSKIPTKQVLRNCTLMQNMDINLDRIEYLTDCLMLQPMIMRNRISILKEMGVKSIGLHHIFRFPSSMQLTLKYFKKLHDIPEEQNIMKNILSNLGIPQEEIPTHVIQFDNRGRTGKYYFQCMAYYKTFYLELHNKTFHKNKKIRYQSFKEIFKVVHVLKTELQLDTKFLQQNPTFLYVDIENVEVFLHKFRHMRIGGKSIFDIVKRFPRILFLDMVNVEEFLHLCQLLGIPDESVVHNTRVLWMKKTTFLTRYINFANKCELALWLKHPRVLSMIYQYNSVINRLSYLKSSEVMNKVNINTYLTARKLFLRYIEGDVCRIHMRKYLRYILNKELGEARVDVLHSIIKHPHWRNVPLLHIEKMLHYLKKHYSIDDICQNIHIILYPRPYVIDTLNSIHKEYASQEGCYFTPAQCLALCLYRMEKKFHFSGDAIWQTISNEMMDDNLNYFKDEEEDILIEYINDDDNEVANLSGTAWLEYMLQSY